MTNVIKKLGVLVGIVAIFAFVIPQIVNTTPVAHAAIALDSTASSTWPHTGSTVTWTHTVTSGSNVVFAVMGHVEPAGDRLNGVTVDGVAATRTIIQNGYANNGEMYLYALATSSAAGTHTIIADYIGSSSGSWVSMAFNGAAQTSTLDSSAGAVGSVAQLSPLTMTTTVVAANSMLISAFQDVDAGWTASTNTTQMTNDPNILVTSMSTATVSAGSQTQVFTRTGTGRVNGWIIASIAPFVATPSTSQDMIVCDE